MTAVGGGEPFIELLSSAEVTRYSYTMGSWKPMYRRPERVARPTFQGDPSVVTENTAYGVFRPYNGRSSTSASC